MLSIEQIRQETEAVREALAKRGEDAPLEGILSLDAQRRSSLTEADDLRAKRNQVSRGDRPHDRKAGPPAGGDAADRRPHQDPWETQVKEAEGQPGGGASEAPQPAPSRRAGGRGRVRQPGDPHVGRGLRTSALSRCPHWDLGERLGIIDLPRGAKVSGSRFFTLTGLGAKLQRALISWMLDLHVQEHGYNEVYVPYMVRKEVMLGSGNLPKFGDNLYHDEEDDLWLIPTAEVPLTGLHRDEILEPDSLPLYYVAHSPSFRREKAGRRQGHARHQARPPVRQGRALQAGNAGDFRRRT